MTQYTITKKQYQNLSIMDKDNDQKADANNSNEGTSGTNDTYQSNQDNRSDQLNPNNDKYGGDKK